jgi:hypothetical protein
MKQIRKEYPKHFLVEPTKLIRLLDIIHDRFAVLPDTTCTDHFTVSLTGDEVEEMTNIADVLALDNSRKHRIQRLEVICSTSAAGDGQPEHEVLVDFGRPKDTAPPAGNKTMVVAVSVRGDTGAWATSTLSEVEEQVERTWQHYVQPLLTLVTLSCLLLLVLLFALPASPDRPFLVMWLNKSDLDRVEALVRGPHIVTDQELREVLTRQLRNVLASERPPQLPTKGDTRQVLFIIIPLAVVLAAIILLARCYPVAVFLWGDEIERHANMLQRRKVLWGVIFAILGGGVLSKFFYEGVIHWFTSK